MLLRISMWSPKNSLICHSHVLSKLSSCLTLSTGGWSNKFKWHLDVRIKCSCLRIFENLLAKNSVYNFQKTYDYQSAMECSVCRVAISKPYQESFLLWAANNLFQGSQDSPQGAKNFFERAKIPLGKQIVKQKVCVNAWFDTTLRGSGCNDIIYANCKTCLNRVDPYERKIFQCVKPKS